VITLSAFQSIAFCEAFRRLAPLRAAELGCAAEAVLDGGLQVVARLRAGEVFDLVIMARDTLVQLEAEGIIAAGSRVDLAVSPIAVAVRAGAPRPTLRDGGDLRAALLAARGVAISTGPSGVHLRTVFERLGIVAEMESRLKVVVGEPAAAPVARGEVDLCFQQLSELLPVPGIDILGPLPDDVQKLTVFSAGVHARTPHPEQARAFARALGSTASAAVIRESGMQPLGAGT